MGRERIRRHAMATLQDTMAKQIPKLRDEVKEFLKAHGEDVVGKVTLSQVYGGMRGVRGAVCDTSSVEPDKGLIIRDIPVKQLTERLPEEIFWLLCTGSMPDEGSLHSLQTDLRKRAQVPDYVWKVLEAMPRDSHPMCMFDTAILCMERESVFRKRYDEGLKKDDYWVATLEDALDIIARLPAIAA